MENIKVVDDIVKRTERLVSEFYGDEETVFVFTADHGMSKIGNHGDGGTSKPPPQADLNAYPPQTTLITESRRSRQHANSHYRLG